MNLYIKGKKISDIRIAHGGSPSEISAADYLAQYAERLGLGVSDSAEFLVRIFCDEAMGDGFSLDLGETGLDVRGGARGVIYGVFSFLERLGCRFFTPTLETLPDGDVTLSPFSVRECSPFEFRDVLGNGATDRVWSLKRKLNSNLWNTRKFTEADGGGYIFAGIPAHSLTGEFLLKPFVESHPEYFSLVDGTRRTDRMGQICMTNDEAAEAAAREACRLLSENPDKNIVSVSQGDNNNFCTCPSCREAVEKRGLMRTYFSAVNKIAAIIKREHPHAIVHTLAYESLCREIDFKLEDNIMLQYCFGKCATHAIDDEGCAINAESARQLRGICEKCDNVYVWNYVNCFKYELMEYPFIHNFRRNIKFFADVGVKGVFNEGVHRSTEETDFATAYELRSYLLSRLMWNPYMSDEELARDMSEFCRAFYGKGGEFIVEYLGLYKKMSGECGNYDMLRVNRREDEEPTVSIVDPRKISEFISRANDLLDRAEALAENDAERRHIDKLRTTVIYFELYHTMDETLAHGDEAARAAALARCSELVDRIISQRLVITFWGQSRADQNRELEGMRSISPKHWNYKW